MVSQEVLIESLRLASRIDELHTQLGQVSRELEAANLKREWIKSVLDDACVQRNEYRDRVTQLEEVIEKGRFVSANAFSGSMKSVVDSINDAVDKFGAGKDDAAMLSLSRALAHSESVVDILSQGQES